MKKIFTKFLAALALLAFFIPSMIAVGQTTVTFTPGTNTGTTSVTISPITATMSTMNNASYYQIYASASGTFTTSTGNITAINFTCTASGKAKYGPGNASADVGTYSYSGTYGTWTGSANSVTISSTAQVRMTTLSITYETSGSTTYTVTYDCNGGTSGCPSNVTDITAGTSITLAAAPTKTDYTFNGWSDGTNTYDAGDSYTVNRNVTMTAQWQLDVNYLFYESFDNCDGTGGNDNSWSGSIASGTLTADNSDWTFVKGSGANKCAKFGTSSALGSAQTPAISHTGNATLTFKAAAWNGSSESTTLKLSATSGTLSASTVTLVKGEWTDYTINITGITTSTQIKFEGNSSNNSRFFLDEVMVVEAAPSTDPSITANDVDIAYDATSGSIEYTLQNGTGNVSATITSGDWLTLGTITSSTVSFTCSANTSNTARTATVTLSYTGASDKVVTVTQALNPNLANIAALTAQTDGNYTVSLTDALVTYTNGTNAYLEDASGAVLLYHCNDNNLNLAVGDKITGTANVTYAVYNNLPEVTAFTLATGYTLTQNNTVTPAEVTIATLESNFTSYISRYVKIVGATVTSAFNNRNSTIEQSGSSIVLRDQNNPGTLTTTVNDIVTVTAHPSIYNTTHQIAVYEQSQIVVAKVNPTITFNNGSVRVGQTLDLSTLFSSNSNGAVTYSITVGDSYATLSGSELTGTAEGSVTVKAAQAETTSYNAGEATTTITVNPALVLSSIAVTTPPTKTTYNEGETFDPTGMVVTATYTDNSTNAVTGYTYLPDGALATTDTEITISYTENNVTKTTTQAITVNEVVDYATLPFTWDNTTQPQGITLNNVGWYTSSSPYIKMNLSNGEGTVVLKLNTAPGVIAFDVIGNGSGNAPATGTFSVMISDDGENYTTLATYNSIAHSLQTMYFTNVSDYTRYIKWSYTKNSNGNVALGNFNIQSIENQSATIIPVANHIYVVNSGATLILDGDYSGTLTNASNLIIKDGGQLITNYAVAATVQKEIEKTVFPPTKDGEAPEGWYSISSSVNPTNIAANTNLVTESKFDLYYYDETASTMQWKNYHQSEGVGFTTMDRGRGYLYRNETDVTIAFTGTVNTNDITYNVTKSEVGTLSGFNLIGNPFTHDISKGSGENIDDNKLNTGFYVATNSGAWESCYDGTIIQKNQGFLVQANTAGDITIKNTVTSKGGDKANHDNIKFMVSNTQYEDVTYAMFDKGRGLNKISHRNAEIPMLYIPQNDENYAIAMMDDNTQAFNLSFKAMTMGKYTLSYKAKGEFNYLHIIDRMTGEDVDMLLESEYSFVGTPSDNENRFIVRLGYMPNYNDNGEDIFAYQNGNDIVVSGEGELQVFDVMGRMISTRMINGVETVNIQTQGVYIMKLNEKTQKIVVR